MGRSRVELLSDGREVVVFDRVGLRSEDRLRVRECYGWDLGGLLEYEPLPVQMAFHGSDARVRMLLGGNGSGKTTAAMADLAWRLMEGMWGYGPPIRAWVVKQRFPADKEMDPVYQRLWFGGDGLAPFIPRWMQDRLEGDKGRVMRLRNGSTVEYRTWGQGWERLQGEAPDLIVMDEEAPSQVYEECRARLFRKPHGRMVLSFTPVVSRRWVMHLLKQAERGDPGVRAWFLDTRENPYLSREQLEYMTAGMSEEEADVRLRGVPRQKFGRVYRVWGPGNWRRPDELPRDGTDYVVIDMGISAPTVALWIRAVPREARDGRLLSDLWIHRQYYRKGETSVRQLVREILEVNGDLRPAAWYLDAWSGRARVYSRTEHDLRLVDLWRQCGLDVQLTPMNRVSRRRERFVITMRYIDLSDEEYPNLYAIREWVPGLEEELELYCVRGLVEPHRASAQMARRAEDFVGPNHFIFCMEMACVMGLQYQEERSAVRVRLRGVKRMSDYLWRKLGDERLDGVNLLGGLGFRG